MARIRVQGPDGQPVEAELLEFKIDRPEEWASYKLEDGTTLRAKLTVLQIAKAIDAEGSTMYREDGQPVYVANHRIEVVADVPDFNLRKDE